MKKNKKPKQKTLEEKYKLVKKRKEELKGLHQRALADYQNLTKRSIEEKQEFAKYANEQLIQDLIPAYDNLLTSIKHFQEGQESSWLEGVKYVTKQFEDIFKNHGLEAIDAVGKEFDYNTMEAIEGKEGKVSEVVKNGYTLNGKVVVPAKVKLKTN